ncbi:MAG: exosortase/archaeosortase family protein [Bacteroidota bacterium]
MLKTYYRKAEDIIIKHKLQALVDVALFAIITIGFHELWWGFSEWIKSFDLIAGSADWLAKQVYISALWINRNILGLNVITTEPNTMWFSINSYVGVDESCSGLKQFYQIAVLFILFPGPWKHKIWYIPMGIIVMFITNVSRIVILSLVVIWQPGYWDFTHDWIMRPFFYVVIFILWVIWVEKFRRAKKQEKLS